VEDPRSEGVIFDQRAAAISGWMMRGATADRDIFQIGTTGTLGGV